MYASVSFVSPLMLAQLHRKAGENRGDKDVCGPLWRRCIYLEGLVEILYIYASQSSVRPSSNLVSLTAHSVEVIAAPEPP